MVTDGKLNDAIIPYVLDTKDKHILADPNPLQGTFKNIKKFDAQNPIISRLLTQIESSKLSEKKLEISEGKSKIAK